VTEWRLNHTDGSNPSLGRLVDAFLETVVMTLVSGVISFAIGLPIGIVLVGTATGGIWENAWVDKIVGAFVNAFRSPPFIILLIALIPLTRLIVGTSIGTAAAIVPLSISGIPYFGRVSEVSLREVDRGLIEAVRAMGGDNWTIIRQVLVPEALPSLVAVTSVLLIGASAMAGAVGAGGLGDLAIRYGYQRFETSVMVAVIVILIALVTLVQAVGDRLSKLFDHR
jgi:D-methionine transport system permease protein